MRGIIAALPVAMLVVVAGCGATSSSTSGATSTTTTTIGLSDDRVAAAAQTYVVDNLGGDPSSSSWGKYITGYTFHAGVLRLGLQVDGQSPDGQQVGRQAAHAVSNFIKLGPPPPDLAQVQWVESLDQTGTHIAQEPVG